MGQDPQDKAAAPRKLSEPIQRRGALRIGCVRRSESLSFGDFDAFLVSLCIRDELKRSNGGGLDVAE